MVSPLVSICIFASNREGYIVLVQVPFPEFPEFLVFRTGSARGAVSSFVGLRGLDLVFPPPFSLDTPCIWFEEVNGTVNKKGVTGHLNSIDNTQLSSF